MKTSSAESGRRPAPKKVIERRLAEQSLGIIAGLRNGALSIEHAEEDLFNLDVYQLARKHRLNRNLVELLECGMQLEDVAQIVPNALEQSYKAIEKLGRQVLRAAKKK